LLGFTHTHTLSLLHDFSRIKASECPSFLSMSKVLQFFPTLNSMLFDIADGNIMTAVRMHCSVRKVDIIKDASIKVHYSQPRSPYTNLKHRLWGWWYRYTFICIWISILNSIAFLNHVEKRGKDSMQNVDQDGNVKVEKGMHIDALLGPGVNPLEGSPNVKLRKLGPKATLPTSNSRKG
jgi:hypothetical protein